MNALSPARMEAPAQSTAGDDDLLAACRAFDALERAFIAVGGHHTGAEEDAADAERECLRIAQEPLVDRICGQVAVTRDGQVARARSLALWEPDLLDDAGETGQRITAAILRDLMSQAT